MLIEFCGTSAMGKTTMARLLSSKDSRYRPFRNSVVGNGFKHRLAQLRIFLMGFFMEFYGFIKKRDFSRFVKLSMQRGAKQDSCLWVLDQGYLQPTALLTISAEYNTDIYISRIRDIGIVPDVVVFFLATPDLAEKRQSMRGDIEIIKQRSKMLGFSSLHEHYVIENQLWLDLVPVLEKKGVSTICIHFDDEGKIKKTTSFVSSENMTEAVVGELTSILESCWDPDL